MRILLTLFILTVSNICFGQVTRLTEPFVFKEGEDVKIFTRMELSPQFPGGEPALNTYIRQNARFSSLAASGLSKGVYTVKLKFIVMADSSIIDVVALAPVGYGLEAEAARLLLAGPKWIPGRQNNYIINGYVEQPFVFYME